MTRISTGFPTLGLPQVGPQSGGISIDDAIGMFQTIKGQQNKERQLNLQQQGIDAALAQQGFKREGDSIVPDFAAQAQIADFAQQQQAEERAASIAGLQALSGIAPPPAGILAAPAAPAVPPGVLAPPEFGPPPGIAALGAAAAVAPDAAIPISPGAVPPGAVPPPGVAAAGLPPTTPVTPRQEAQRLGREPAGPEPDPFANRFRAAAILSNLSPEQISAISQSPEAFAALTGEALRTPEQVRGEQIALETAETTLEGQQLKLQQLQGDLAAQAEFDRTFSPALKAELAQATALLDLSARESKLKEIDAKHRLAGARGPGFIDITDPKTALRLGAVDQVWASAVANTDVNLSDLDSTDSLISLFSAGFFGEDEHAKLTEAVRQTLENSKNLASSQEIGSTLNAALLPFIDKGIGDIGFVQESFLPASENKKVKTRLKDLGEIIRGLRDGSLTSEQALSELRATTGKAAAPGEPVPPPPSIAKLAPSGAITSAAALAAELLIE